MINQSPPYEHNNDLVLQQFCFHWHYFCPTYFKSFLPFSLLGKHRKPLTILEQKIQIYFRKQNNIAQQDKSDIFISLVKLPYLDQFKNVKEQSQTTPITSKWNKKGEKNDFFFVCLFVKENPHHLLKHCTILSYSDIMGFTATPQAKYSLGMVRDTQPTPHTVCSLGIVRGTPYPNLVLLNWSMLHWLG